MEVARVSMSIVSRCIDNLCIYWRVAVAVLDNINSPADLKGLDYSTLEQLVTEIRELLKKTVTLTGGHLASSLGVVELTIALHRIFNSPEDKIIWDVGHQSYTHKLLTGR